jgi:hypothetical protein
MRWACAATSSSTGTVGATTIYLSEKKYRALMATRGDNSHKSTG